MWVSYLINGAFFLALLIMSTMPTNWDRYRDDDDQRRGGPKP